MDPHQIQQMVTIPDISPEKRKLAKMSKLAQSFPSLVNAPGVSPWDQHKLDAWAAEPISHGERCTAQFILSVWGQTSIQDCPWKCGPFDFFEAFRVWDDAHRAAFTAWTREPWWP